MKRKDVAFVTGGSSGIGRAVALRLAGQGFTVAVSARRAAELDAVAAEHGGIVSFPGDVADGKRMAEIVTAVEAALGPITLAFLNHGVYFPAERQGFDAEVVWRTFEVNVGGVINCLAPLLAAMEARGGGQIAITASLAGYGGVPGSMAYGASKAALIYMAEVLRMTYEPRGLKIQIVNPGFVETPMTDHANFDMPFLMSAQKAAAIICDGFDKRGFEIAFPRRLALLFKAARLLPYPLLLPLMRRLARRARTDL
ncbi:short-chain dehydrogenase/reductase SDR [Methylocella silvestris BL2]|uniref:Short-chain dehydrogenase/reductase SDR n=1 Tax=Methylocella silvestris (strain DSM 15510 / CIP 108128 / LMG 27833 / NCIMB 13906 / BL2) TaxID=395965 RepID=B8EQT0_METSB|nr:SDR family NAD(P)-dependent oxidoreductase [Methylocella silvestris]ACK49351.1 short-chain dehydrogenase/reductase SDR [Methylocella silvestris BL2]